MTMVINYLSHPWVHNKSPYSTSRLRLVSNTAFPIDCNKNQVSASHWLALPVRELLSHPHVNYSPQSPRFSSAGGFDMELVVALHTEGELTFTSPAHHHHERRVIDAIDRPTDRPFVVIITAPALLSHIARSDGEPTICFRVPSPLPTFKISFVILL